MKLLIVEDDATIADMMAEALAKWGFRTVRAEDYERVLELFVREDPQLVLMDINLPAFDGFHWCSRIRELSKVPILFISSRNTPIDMVMAMNMGGDDFIQKPFLTDVLIAKINALLRRTYAYADTPLRVIEHEGVVINLNDGQVTADGQKCELTRTEFMILKLLLQHKGTVVTRTRLMRSLWEDENFVDDNTLTVNVARLRKKLGGFGREHLISTRKGEGYSIP